MNSRLTTLLLTILTAGALAGGLLAQPAVAEQASPHAARRAAYKPTLAASKAQVDTGGRVVLSGKVRPATKGGTVIIQKRIGDRKWAEEKRTTMSRSGRFSYTDKPGTPGLRKYRAVVPKAGNHAKGASKPVTVTVYRWLDLSQVRVRSSEGTWVRPSSSINAVEYDRSYVGDNQYSQTGFVDWNLDRACTALRARFGNSDDSDDVAIAHIEALTDGDAAYSHDFALTESEVRSIDLRGVFRFSFTWSSTNPAGPPDDQSGASAVMAEPQVHCAF